MYSHKGIHGPSGAGPEKIYYFILSNAQPEASGRQPPLLARARAPPGAEAAFSLVEKQV